MAGKTLYDKIWDAHVVHTDEGGESLLYIDLHLIHEVTTPQAFAGLKAAGRGVRRSMRDPDGARRCVFARARECTDRQRHGVQLATVASRRSAHWRRA